MKSKMRFVLDTNVIVSSILFAGSKPRQVFNKAVTRGVILLSQPVIDELVEVLNRPKFDRYLIEEERKNTLETLVKEAEIVAITQTITACRDPKDDKYLELAVNGNAGFIISGDNDLLILNPFQGILILNPEDFLQLNIIK